MDRIAGIGLPIIVATRWQPSGLGTVLSSRRQPDFQRSCFKLVATPSLPQDRDYFVEVHIQRWTATPAEVLGNFRKLYSSLRHQEIDSDGEGAITHINIHYGVLR